MSDVGQLKDGDDKDVDDNHDEDKDGDDNDDEDKDGDHNDVTLHLPSALRLLLLTYISNHTQERKHVHSAYIRIFPGACLRSSALVSLGDFMEMSQVDALLLQMSQVDPMILEMSQLLQASWLPGPSLATSPFMTTALLVTKTMTTTTTLLVSPTSSCASPSVCQAPGTPTTESQGQQSHGFQCFSTIFLFHQVSPTVSTASKGRVDQSISGGITFTAPEPAA